MQLLPADYAIIAIAAVFGVVGLFRGFSGELGAVCGWAAGIAAGFLGWPYLSVVLTEPGMRLAAVVAGSVLTLLVVRAVVRRVVRCILRQPLDAVAGLTLGLVKVALIVGLAAHFGLGKEFSAILSFASREAEKRGLATTPDKNVI